jgi:ribosome-binding ATPase
MQSLGLSPEQLQAVRGYNFLSLKPVLYVANVAESSLPDGGPEVDGLGDALTGASVLAVSAQIEAELTQLAEAERREFMAALGLAESGIQRLIVAGYKLLNLITFYTVANQKLQAWQVPYGTVAPVAAGRIHGDMEKGFIRAEVAAFADLAEAGSMSRAREAGRLRTEGRDYRVQDGDVVHFLFKA